MGGVILVYGSIAISVVALIYLAAAKVAAIEMAYVHLAVAAITALFLAFLAVRDGTRRLAGKEGDMTRAAATARNMGSVWAWGTIALIATYATGIADWFEWWHFVLAFAAATLLSFVWAAILAATPENSDKAASLMRFGRYLAMFQLGGMIVIMLGLLVDGKMWRFFEPRYGDWAANNIFFCGAMALAIMSYFALRQTRANAS